MEQSILENSKGATYMSFILDIEIVIKKEGVRTNVAESKAKSQVPKQGDVKGVSKKQDYQVYAMSPDQKNIFEFPIGSQQDDHKSSLKTNKDSEQSVIDKEIDQPGLTNEETCSRESKKSVKPFEEGNLIDNDIPITTDKPKKKKKKLTKSEKKAKVFKGKVEAIDFLECNRIFLCNFFKITNNQAAKRRSDSQLIINKSNSTRFTSQHPTEVPISKSKSESGSRVHSKKRKPTKIFTFWKKSSSKIVQGQENCVFKNHQSAGDNEKVEFTNVEGNETTNNTQENNQKKYIKLQKMLQISQTLTGFRKIRSKNKIKLRTFNKSSKVLSEQSVGVNFSEMVLSFSDKSSKNEISRKTQSVPEIKNDCCNDDSELVSNVINRPTTQKLCGENHTDKMLLGGELDGFTSKESLQLLKGTFNKSSSSLQHQITDSSGHSKLYQDIGSTIRSSCCNLREEKPRQSLKVKEKCSKFQIGVGTTNEENCIKYEQNNNCTVTKNGIGKPDSERRLINKSQVFVSTHQSEEKTEKNQVFEKSTYDLSNKNNVDVKELKKYEFEVGLQMTDASTRLQELEGYESKTDIEAKKNKVLSPRKYIWDKMQKSATFFKKLCNNNA